MNLGEKIIMWFVLISLLVISFIVGVGIFKILLAIGIGFYLSILFSFLLIVLLAVSIIFR